MKPFKIKGLSTYVFYVTIVNLHNMRARLLTFQNGILSQDLCSRANTWFYLKKFVPGTLKSLLQLNDAKKIMKLTGLVRAIN